MGGVARLVRRLRPRRERARTSLPAGTITFLLTDIESSTRLWETAPEQMENAVVRHNGLIAQAVAANGGILIRERGEGDSTFSVFTVAADGVAAALQAQLALHAEPWPLPDALRVRMALHTGDVRLVAGEYTAPEINRCARIRALGHGGQTLVSQRTATTAGSVPNGGSFRDMGSHRLRDLTRPERLYQLCHPGLPAEFPDLLSLDVRPNNLPTQLTTFIGRETEIAGVRKTLQHSRVVTLCGFGGMGKTRLALQVAAEVMDDFPDGVWLAELAAVTDHAHVVRVVAEALRLREEPGRASIETLTDAVARRRTLIVLDNCEHVLAEASDLAARLLRAGPDVRLLATSREALRVPGAVPWPLRALSIPEPASREAKAVLESEAVRLFCDRAALVRPDFALTPANAPDIARLCRKLEGIPLAVEMAAARVGVLQPAEIETRLDDRFRLLRGGPGDAPGTTRHATLQAAIDWSHELLDGPSRALLRRLSTFSGGFRLDAAESVAPDGTLQRRDVLDVLSRLVDKSFVVPEYDEVSTRFTMLETIRAYAAERLDEAGETDESHTRHLAWCIALAEEAEPQIDGAGQQQWLDRLDREHGNLRAALSWAAGSPARKPEALRLAGPLWMFWFVRGHWREGRAWLESVLEDSSGAPAALRIKALVGAGGLAQCVGAFKEARARHDEALHLQRETGDRRGEAETISDLAKLAIMQRHLEEAGRLSDEGLRLVRELGDPRLLAMQLNTAAEIAELGGNPDEATALFGEALELARKAGDERRVSRAALSMARVAAATQRFDEAESLLREGLDISRRLGDKMMVAHALHIRASVLDHRGDVRGARHDLEQCIALARELGERALLAHGLMGLASLADTASEREAARSQLAEACGILERAGDGPALASALFEVARLEDTGGTTDAARAAYETARDHAAQAGADHAYRAAVEALERLGPRPAL